MFLQIFHIPAYFRDYNFKKDYMFYDTPFCF